VVDVLAIFNLFTVNYCTNAAITGSDVHCNWIRFNSNPMAVFFP